MTVPTLLDLGIAALILGLGAWAVLVRSSHAAIAGFLAYGLLLTLAWVRLEGIDVALTEAAIGGGLTTALLLGAAGRLRRTEDATHAERPAVGARWLAALLSTAVAGAIGYAVLSLPVPAPTLAPEVMANLPSTQVGNPITGVLLAFRGVDTLLESIVLVFALLGIWSLAPDRAWGGRPGEPQAFEPNGILTYAARVLPPLGIVVALYVFWAGADDPGGKFQAATLLAAMGMLTYMAGLSDSPSISRRWVRLIIVGGPLLFIGVGVLGAYLAGAFLGYPDGFAKPMIVVIEFALLPTLTLVLAFMLLGPPRRGVEP